MDTLLSNFNLAGATELIVTGGSAGGLSTFLHMDYVHKRMPSSTRVTGAPVVGYFLDHPTYDHSPSNYTAWMK